jgi:hypothetical protein
MTKETHHLAFSCLLALFVTTAACVHPRAGEQQRNAVGAAAPKQGECSLQKADESQERPDLEELCPDCYVGIDG